MPYEVIGLHAGTHCQIVTCHESDGALKEPQLIWIHEIKRTVLICPQKLLFSANSRLSHQDWEIYDFEDEIQVIDEVQDLQLVAHPRSWPPYRYSQVLHLLILPYLSAILPAFVLLMLNLVMLIIVDFAGNRD